MTEVLKSMDLDFTMTPREESKAKAQATLEEMAARAAQAAAEKEEMAARAAQAVAEKEAAEKVAENLEYLDVPSD